MKKIVLLLICWLTVSPPAFASSLCSDHYDLEKIKQLLKNGADLNEKCENGKTPIYKFSRRGPKEIVEFLIQNGANINAKDKSGSTPVFGAALNGKVEIVKLLIKNGANVKEKNRSGNTPLFMAAWGGRPEVVNFLLKQGADINARNKNGDTPLFHAAQGDSPEVVNFLLKQGADINARNKNSITPVFNAALEGNNELVSLFVRKGASVNVQDAEAGATLLHEAALKCKPEITEMLIQKGADPNAKDRKGRTPSYYTAHKYELFAERKLDEEIARNGWKGEQVLVVKAFLSIPKSLIENDLKLWKSVTVSQFQAGDEFVKSEALFEKLKSEMRLGVNSEDDLELIKEEFTPQLLRSIEIKEGKADIEMQNNGMDGTRHWLFVKQGNQWKWSSIYE